MTSNQMASHELTSNELPLDNPFDWIKGGMLSTQYLLAVSLRIASYVDAHDKLRKNPSSLIGTDFFLDRIVSELTTYEAVSNSETKDFVLMEKMVLSQSAMFSSAKFSESSSQTFDFAPSFLTEIMENLTEKQKFLLASAIRLSRKLYWHEFNKRNPHPGVGKDALLTVFLEELRNIRPTLDNSDKRAMQRAIDDVLEEDDE